MQLSSSGPKNRTINFVRTDLSKTLAKTVKIDNTFAATLWNVSAEITQINYVFLSRTLLAFRLCKLTRRIVRDAERCELPSAYRESARIGLHHQTKVNSAYT